MNAITRDTALDTPASSAPPLDIRLEFIGEHATRLSVITVLGWIGAMKFTAYKAGAI